MVFLDKNVCPRFDLTRFDLTLSRENRSTPPNRWILPERFYPDGKWFILQRRTARGSNRRESIRQETGALPTLVPRTKPLKTVRNSIPRADRDWFCEGFLELGPMKPQSPTTEDVSKDGPQALTGHGTGNRANAIVPDFLFASCRTFKKHSLSPLADPPDR